MDVLNKKGNSGNWWFFAGKATRSIKEKAVLTFLEEYESMKALSRSHPFFGELLRLAVMDPGVGSAFVKGNVNSGGGVEGESRYDLLKKADGAAFAMSFNKNLKLSANEEGAVERWMGDHQALSAFGEKYRFFNKFMQTIGREKNCQVTFTKVMVSVGCSVASIVDVGSDCYAVFFYLENDRIEIGTLLLAFLLTSLFLQLMLVILVHHGNWKKMWEQLFFTITFAKPGVNWYNVLTSKESEGHELLDPVHEMMFFQLAEVFGEAIPCSVLQISGLIRSDELDALLIVSVLVSALVTADAVSYMTYFADVNLDNRRIHQQFYGFWPVDGVGLLMVHLSMHLLGLTQLLIRSLSIAEVYAIGESSVGGAKLVALFLVCDGLIFIVYKLLRSDLVYHVKFGRGLGNFIFSFVFRWFSKVVVDFTAIVQFRHPYELGGAFWVFTLLFTHLELYAILMLKGTMASANEEGEGEEVKNDYFFTSETIWKIAFGLSGLWIMSLVMLWGYCEDNFRHTFWDIRTAEQYCREFYHSGDDEAKMSIFTLPDSFWMGFADEVEEWMSENWNRLHRDNPKWFTDGLIHSVPTVLVPYYDNTPAEERSVHFLSDLLSGGTAAKTKRRRGTTVLK